MIHSSDLLPNGFHAVGTHAGIGKKKTKPDLAVFFSTKICKAAGLFTTNLVKAAPVLVSQRVIQRGLAQAIIVNSGCANACTGPGGFSDALEMCRLTAEGLSVEKQNIIVASTGVIGKPLPMAKVRKGIGRLAGALRNERFSAKERRRCMLTAVYAIMTTDRVPKMASRKIRVGGKVVSVWGCVKGAGMIHPKMATMLAFIFTDADISLSAMRGMLKREAEKTFNALSVDGDTSTNDSVFLLANGLSGTVVRRKKECAKFQNALGEVCASLASQMAADGEGATKQVVICVKGARTAADAKKVAETIATSPLVKTALFGEDANWGRVIAAAGRAGVRLNPDKIEIFFGQVRVAQNGAAVRFSEKKAKKVLEGKVVPVTLNLHDGKASARYFTCDLSIDYVKINANYRT